MSMLYKSSDDKSEKNYHMHISTSQPSPEEKAHCICTFNDRYKDTQNWIREIRDQNCTSHTVQDELQIRPQGGEADTEEAEPARSRRRQICFLNQTSGFSSLNNAV